MMTIINKLGLGIQGDGFERPMGSRRMGGRGQGEGGALGRVGEGKGGGKRREEVPK